MTEAKTATPTPLWLTLLTNQGLAVLLILYFIGLIPGTESPLSTFHADHKSIAEAVARHDQTLSQLLRVNRMICRGVWKDSPVRDECDR